MRSDRRMDARRGTGRTTKQIVDAPIGAVFVWGQSVIDYPVALAAKLGRDDLWIVPPRWLDLLLEGTWSGIRFSGIVIDHAAQLTEIQEKAFAKYAPKSWRKHEITA